MASRSAVSILFSLLLFSLLSNVLCTDLAQAQEIEADQKKAEPFLNVFTGYSPLSVWLLGKTPDSQTFMVSANYNIPIKQLKRNIDLYYSAGIIPYIWFNYSKRDRNGDKYTARGFGLYPVGFNFMRKFKPGWSYMAQTAGGIIYMDQVFPTDKSKRLNFSFELSLSLHKKLSDRFGIYFGYKFHHISNAQTGVENPGLDSNFLFLSLSYFN